jgi:Flp pilus assembly protein TadB
MIFLIYGMAWLTAMVVAACFVVCYVMVVIAWWIGSAICTAVLYVLASAGLFAWHGVRRRGRHHSRHGQVHTISGRHVI